MSKMLELRVTSSVVASISALVLLVSSISAADAGGRHFRGYSGGVYIGDGAAAAGFIGLAAGAILGSALSTPRSYGPRYYGAGYDGGPIYYDPPRRYRPPVYAHPRIGPPRYAPRRYGPRPYPHRSRVYVAPPRQLYAPPLAAPPVRYRAAPFTPEWIAYCARKYKSFNPRTGTYLAYSGKIRMCR
ncbi:BA14K family protein [Roseibium algae]|uniref:Lectin-like protein BA14k n=1 Tax=Roseibium algae TaxID=3123038 RepID=A0ABU8TGF1_9HYPH